MRFPFSHIGWLEIQDALIESRFLLYTDESRTIKAPTPPGVALLFLVLLRIPYDAFPSDYWQSEVAKVLYDILFLIKILL